jgi:RNA polymerase sigma-70 factor (ECF subfamily)
MRRQLARAINRTCPAWLAARREDIVQAAMIRVIQARRTSEHNSTPPASYLWKVAYSATVDEIRRARREREGPLEEAGGLDDEPRAPTDPHRDQLTREKGRAIQDCLDRLQERRRLVVGLHLVGYTLTETEQYTEWGAKKVKNLLYRGLNDLRQCLTMRGVAP